MGIALPQQPDEPLIDLTTGTDQTLVFGFYFDSLPVMKLVNVVRLRVSSAGDGRAHGDHVQLSERGGCVIFFFFFYSSRPHS